MQPDNLGRRLSYVPVVRPKPNQTIPVLILSDRIEQWRIHWTGTQDQPCLAPLGRSCPLCQESEPRVTFYALALDEQKRRCIVPITCGAVEHCPDLKEQLDNAFGLVVALRRGQRTNGGVHAQVLKHCQNPDLLVRPPYTLREALARMWDAPCLLQAGAEPPADGPTDDPAAVVIPFPPGYVDDTTADHNEQDNLTRALKNEGLRYTGAPVELRTLVYDVIRAQQQQGGAADPRA